MIKELKEISAIRQKVNLIQGCCYFNQTLEPKK
jgi:cell division FtsZ-interacting protein ZapD